MIQLQRLRKHLIYGALLHSLKRHLLFPRMFERLAQLEGRSSLAFLNTHPATTQRIKVRIRVHRFISSQGPLAD